MDWLIVGWGASMFVAGAAAVVVLARQARRDRADDERERHTAARLRHPSGRLMPGDPDNWVGPPIIPGRGSVLVRAEDFDRLEQWLNERRSA